jgi:membrane protein DedA with SNARE-associated domain
VVLVATAAGEVGGLIGYAIGNRWGRELLERPGKHQAGRQRMVERGERAYARWGRLAVFFTPAIVSGTAKMHHGQFVLWNLVASFAFAVSVGASGYGIGGLFSGNTSPRVVGTLFVGIVLSAVVMVVHVERRRRSARRATETAGDSPE